MSREPVPAADLERVLGWCAADWEALRGARLLITGGTGFIGIWLLATALHANRALGLGLGIVAISRDPERFRRRAPSLADDPALTLIAGDVRTFPLPPGRFSHVIHGATDASAAINETRPLEMIDTVVDGTRHVLDLAVSAGARRVLFLSSGAVHGRQPASLPLVSEDHLGGPDQLHPASAYSEAKRLAEQLCAIYRRAHGLEVVIARCWALVGPHLPLDTHFAIGNLIRDGLSGGPLVIRGDGTSERSYLYAADLAAWLWRILLRAEPLRPVNVGSTHGLSLRRLAEHVAACFTPPPTVEVRGVTVPGAAIDRYVPDTARARRELGLEEWTGLGEALRRTIAWHRPSAG